jgi:probable F420-dependent oxidoreductase
MTVTPQLSMGLTSFSKDAESVWETMVSEARVLDAAGVDRLVVSDHVVFGEKLDEYSRSELGGQAGGRQPTGPDGSWLEPLTTLAVLAGLTTQIRLGTSILLAGLRRPVVLAKTASTLDVLSGGRLDLGVGVGWQRAEYQGAGLEFANRGRLLDHTLEVCQILWTERRAEYHSPELDFEAIHMMPKPVQDGGIPLWISGTVNPRVVRRLARFGVGWIPWGPAAADLVSSITEMKQALAEVGRDPSDLQVVGRLPVVRDEHGSMDLSRSMEAVPGLSAAGVTDFRISMRLSPEPSAALEHLSTVVAAFRTATGRPDHLALSPATGAMTPICHAADERIENHGQS